MMRIAIDAMGGDFAPREIVRGGALAARQLKDIDAVILVGDEKLIREELQACGAAESERLRVCHAAEVISMEDAPASAVRKKRDSSINRCVSLIKDCEAEAAVSAGNSGAFSAAAMFGLGRIKGVARPVIAAVLPTRDRPLLLVDAGANMDCEPAWLAQFAIMGSAYSQAVLRQPNPVVGLLSIGTEDSKGNEMTKRAFHLIQRTGVNFRGNVEGRDLFLGKTDVVVCDGFVGNVVLKTTESVAHAISFWMKKEFVRHPLRMLGALLLKGALSTLKHRMDPEIYGGAPLLGVNGPVIITHGASSQKAIFHAVRVAAIAARNNVIDEIASRISAMPLHDAPLPHNGGARAQ